MTDSLTRLTASLADRYRVERELGQGGMATVYLAEDLKHDRKVAIKVLRAELAAVIGAERFLREIKTIATLQHPHILGLIDSGEVNGTAYYVMPFVEGESLRDRLDREKQLPISDAVRLATEVAGALDYAHRHGVIHRDIKPENVLLHDGSALVADFGIALAVSSAGGGSRMTETGMSLGTPHYMSPEQAMGEREITARSDVYALGVTTYEMLTGDPPFTGSTAQAIIAKVMTSDPVGLIAQRRSIPVSVEAAVLTALEKLPADRFATAAEFSRAINGSTDGLGRATQVRQGAVPANRRPMALLGCVAAIATVVAFITGRQQGLRNAPVSMPSRLSLVIPTLGGSGGSPLTRQLSITPNGDAIVFAAQTPLNEASLFMHRLDGESAVEIPGAGGMFGPEISSDGRTIIGSTFSSTRRIPFGGGTSHIVSVGANSQSGAPAPDGSYWFTEANATGISVLTTADSIIRMAPDRTAGLRIQQILDQHTGLVVRAPSGTASGPLLLIDLKSFDITPLLDGPVVEARVVGGELLTVLPDGGLHAAPFDTRGRRIAGPDVLVASGIALTGTGLAQFAVSLNGTVAFIPETPRALVIVDRQGTVLSTINELLNLHTPQFSPDGRRLSFDLTSGEGRDVWVYSLDQKNLTRATFDRDGHDATWTPSGDMISYLSFKSGVAGIYRTRPGNTAPAESLLASPRIGYTGTWLHDGSALITDGTMAAGGTLAGNSDVVRIGNGGRGPIEALVASPFAEWYGLPSRDGEWLAYVSDKSGSHEVYVRPLNGTGDDIQVSLQGGTEPMWSPVAPVLYYRSPRGGDVVLVAATMQTSPSLSVTRRDNLFSVVDMISAAPHSNYDVAPDGNSFAMVRRSQGNRIMVIQGIVELARRLRAAAGSE